jgi:hypothetical protein
VGAILALGACGLSAPTRPAEPDGDLPAIDAQADAPIDAGMDVIGGIDAAIDVAGPIDAGIDVMPPACVGSLEGGSHAGTVYYPVTDRIGLETTFFNGLFESQLLDGVSPGHVWSTIHWTPLRPSKPLPDNNMSESGFYTAGAAIMSSNVFLAHLDEASGTSYDDSSSSPAVGTCVTPADCPTPAPDGVFGRSADFHGFDMNPTPPPDQGGNRIDFADSTTLEPGNVTIETWIQVDSVPSAFGTGMAFTKGHHSGAPPTSAFGSYSIEYDQLTSLFKCYMGFDGVSDTDRTLIGTMPLPITLPSAWVHVACTYDGATYRIYVNGQQRNFAARTEPILYSTMPEQGLYLGAWYSWQFLDGRLDEVAIYDTALSASEIRDHYLRGSTRITFQVRSCPDPSCTGIEFLGPDGTPFTRYTEQCRPPGGTLPLGPPTLDLNNVDCNLDGLADHTPADPVVPPNRYIQFSARLQSPPFVPDADEVQLLGVTLCQ